MAHNPSNNIGIFLGLGYNAGVMYYIAPDKQVQGYISAMYGINAVIKVVGASNYDETYTAPSIGLGIIMKSGKNPNNQWGLGIIIPARSSQFNDD